jgi:hypothetical protein
MELSLDAFNKGDYVLSKKYQDLAVKILVLQIDIYICSTLNPITMDMIVRYGCPYLFMIG